jgi:hypothetical protein
MRRPPPDGEGAPWIIADVVLGITASLLFRRARRRQGFEGVLYRRSTCPPRA